MSNYRNLPYIEVNSAQLEHILLTGIPAREQFCIVGASGIGKSQIVTAVFRKLLETVWKLCGGDLLILHPVTDEPTNIKGLPVVTINGVDFEIFGDMRLMVNATRPLMVFIDDLGQATNAMQAAYMQLIEARRVNSKVISDHVVFVAATNDRTHRAGVSGLLDPLKKRFEMLWLRPDLESWSVWAAGNGINPRIIAYLRSVAESAPEHFYNDKPTTDMTVNACPRGWDRVSRMQALGFRSDVLPAIYSGAVGLAAGTGYAAFCSTYDNMVPPDTVFADPNKASIPADASSMWALTTALAHKVKPQTLTAYLAYMNRLCAAGKRDYVMYSMNLMTARDPSLQASAAFTAAMTGSPLGKLMTEAN